MTITEELLDRIEQQVADTEERTSAEIVVVLAGRSGAYRDLAVLVGAGVGLVTLLLLLYVPLSFPAATVVPLTVLAGLAGGVLAGRSPSLMRVLSLEERRRAQVRAAARVSFVDEAVSATRERTGLLIYLSFMEDRIELLSDHGLDAKIPQGEWNELVATGSDLPWDERIGDLLARATPLLEERFPPTGDNPDEIPNRPRVLP